MSERSKSAAKFYKWRDEVLRKLAKHTKINPSAYEIGSLILIRVNSDTLKAYPSISRLVRESGQTRPTVIRNLKALSATGHLDWKLEKAPGAERSVNHYWFILNPDPTSITSDTSSDASTRPC